MSTYQKLRDIEEAITTGNTYLSDIDTQTNDSSTVLTNIQTSNNTISTNSGTIVSTIGSLQSNSDAIVTALHQSNTLSETIQTNTAEISAIHTAVGNANSHLNTLIDQDKWNIQTKRRPAWIGSELTAANNDTTWFSWQNTTGSNVYIEDAWIPYITTTAKNAWSRYRIFDAPAGGNRTFVFGVSDTIDTIDDQFYGLTSNVYLLQHLVKEETISDGTIYYFKFPINYVIADNHYFNFQFRTVNTGNTNFVSMQPFLTYKH